MGPEVSAVLVETRASNSEELNKQVDNINKALKEVPTVKEFSFTSNPLEYNPMWDIRKGLFPKVGAIRPAETSVMLEDVAVPVDRLADVMEDLQSLFHKFEYNDVIIFGAYFMVTQFK